MNYRKLEKITQVGPRVFVSSSSPNIGLTWPNHGR